MPAERRLGVVNGRDFSTAVVDPDGNDGEQDARKGPQQGTSQGLEKRVVVHKYLCSWVKVCYT